MSLGLYSNCVSQWFYECEVSAFIGITSGCRWVTDSLRILGWNEETVEAVFFIWTGGVFWEGRWCRAWQTSAEIDWVCIDVVVDGVFFREVVSFVESQAIITQSVKKSPQGTHQLLKKSRISQTRSIAQSIPSHPSSRCSSPPGTRHLLPVKRELWGNPGAAEGQVRSTSTRAIWRHSSPSASPQPFPRASPAAAAISSTHLSTSRLSSTSCTGGCSLPIPAATSNGACFPSTFPAWAWFSTKADPRPSSAASNRKASDGHAPGTYPWTAAFSSS